MRLRTAVAVGLAVVLLASAMAAFAMASFLPVFKSTYKIPSGSALASANCAICHPKSSTSTLNPYGAELKKVLVNGKVTKESLAKVESKDSDKDGCSNIAEIKAGTLPGDPNSKPASK